MIKRVWSGLSFLEKIGTVIFALTTLASIVGFGRSIVAIPQKLDEHIQQESLVVARHDMIVSGQQQLIDGQRAELCVLVHQREIDKQACLERYGFAP